MKTENEFKTLENAKYVTVHNHCKGGTVKLSEKIGVTQATLSNKVNINMPKHKLSLNESVRVQQVTKHYAILHETARLLDHVCLPIPDTELENVSDLDLVDSWGRWHAQIGTTVQTIREALDDKIVDQNELRDIERDMHYAITCGMALLERFKVMAQS